MNLHPKAKETFVYFLSMGATAFGGPLALIARMQKDLVEDRGWMERESFTRSFALIKAMPGPIALQTATLLGRHRAGHLGGFAAAIGLNMPPFILMVLFGMFYAEIGQWRSSAAFLTGMQAGALGVIFASTKGLAWAYRKRMSFWIVAPIVALITGIAPSYEPLLIIGAGAAVALWSSRPRGLMTGALPNLAILEPAAAAAAAAVSEPAFSQLAWTCFKSGAFVFGSGLAIVPLMENDFVRELGWLTHQEFMNALALGQITPGPVSITATFIGYKALGLAGAVIATAAINLAPFIHMMTWFPRAVDRLAKVRWVPDFSAGAVAAAVGAIVATAVRLSASLESPWLTLPIVLVVWISSLKGWLPIWALIPISGFSGFILKLAH